MALDQSESDVIVIGGGVIGLTSAYLLAKAGTRVTLLERDLCGQEASWAGAGVLRPESRNPADPLNYLLRKSVCRYAGLIDELRELTRINPDFIPSGSFELLLDNEDYRRAFCEVDAAQVDRQPGRRPPLKLLSAEAARRSEPELTENLVGVKHCPSTCQVRSPRLLQALRAACLYRHVNIREQCPAHGLVRHQDRVVGVHSEAGKLMARYVVLAAGPWSPLIDSGLRELIPVHPVRGQVVLLQMESRPFTHILEWGDHYLVPRLDGRIVVGATEEHHEGFEKRNTLEGVHRLLSVAQRLVPRTVSATIARTWSGVRPGTSDNRPHLGSVPGYEGLIVATGHFNNGLTLAPMTAEIITELVVNGQTSYDLTSCVPGRVTDNEAPNEVLRMPT